MLMKMWCVCRKKDRRPIKLGVDDHYSGETNDIGFATKKDLQEVAGKPEHDEEIRRINFEY